MLEMIQGVPAGVIGVEAVGEVHADDYRTILRPAVDAAAAAGHIRLVYLLGDRFSSYSSGASWQDAKLGAAHLTAWERTAIVSDNETIHHLAHMFGWMFPGDFQLLSIAELQDAIAWAAADD